MLFMRRGTWEIFCLVSFIKKESSDNPERATPYSAESPKLQKLTKQNATNHAPPTWTWVQRLSNRVDAAPLRPNQGHVVKHIAEEEGGGPGACR